MRKTRLVNAEQVRQIFDYEVAQGATDLFDAFDSAIENATTVDAAPVVHDEWDVIEDDYCGMIALKCSECNEEFWFEDEVSLERYHYCPNCGAKMDGGVSSD